MGVSEIPTNRPIQRIDDDDEVYRTEREKNEAILKQIADCHAGEEKEERHAWRKLSPENTRAANRPPPTFSPRATRRMSRCGCGRSL